MPRRVEKLAPVSDLRINKVYGCDQLMMAASKGLFGPLKALLPYSDPLAAG